MVGGCNNESVSSVSESEKLKKVTCINYPELYRGIGKKMDVGSHVKKSIGILKAVVCGDNYGRFIISCII